MLDVREPWTQAPRTEGNHVVCCAGDPHRPIEVTDDVVAFYRMLYQRASERHFVDVGLFTTSGAEALLPLAPPRWRGIVYTFAEPLVDATPAPDALAAVPLTQDELYVGVKFGAVRILSMLGNHYRRFPTAAWLDPHRPSVVSPGDMQASLLGSMGRITLAGGWIYSRGIEVRRDVRPSTGALENAAVGFARQAIVFELSTFRATEIAQVLTQVGPSGPVALIGAPDRQADACFCWVPGHSAPYAITGPEATATRIAANHLAIVAEQDADSAAYLEDGFALLLTNRTWEELCHRLQAGPQNWVMPLRGPLGFRLKTIVT